MLTFPTLLAWVLGAAMVCAAGVLRGFSGFGFSIAAVPLLTLLFPPAQIVPFVMLLQIGVSANGVGEAWRLADRRSLVALTLGALVATPLGLWGLTYLPAGVVRGIIAVVVALTVALLATGARFGTGSGRSTALGCGLLSGLFNGLVGMPGPPVIAYYLAAPLATAVGRASMIILFLITAIAGLIPLALAGHVGWPAVLAALCSFPLVWVSSSLGAALYRRSPEAGYRRVALGILGATAILAAVRALWDLLG